MRAGFHELKRVQLCGAQFEPEAQRLPGIGSVIAAAVPRHDVDDIVGHDITAPSDCAPGQLMMSIPQDTIMMNRTGLLLRARDRGQNSVHIQPHQEIMSVPVTSLARQWQPGGPSSRLNSTAFSTYGYGELTTIATRSSVPVSG